MKVIKMISLVSVLVSLFTSISFAEVANEAPSLVDGIYGTLDSSMCGFDLVQDSSKYIIYATYSNNPAYPSYSCNITGRLIQLGFTPSENIFGQIRTKTEQPCTIKVIKPTAFLMTCNGVVNVFERYRN